MKLREYWPLVRDARTIARTMARVRAGSGRGGPPHGDHECLRAAVARIHPPRIAVRVTDERRESRTARTLALAPQDCALPPFAPGQHLLVHLSENGTPATRTAAITSRPGCLDVMEITVTKRRRDPLVASLVDDVRRGDRLVVSGPVGDRGFHPVRDTDDLVFIARGEGMIGFISTIEHLLETRPSARVLVLHGARELDDLPFRERLHHLSEAHRERLVLKLFLARPPPDWSGERGPLTADAVGRVAIGEGLEQKTFFLGGPVSVSKRLREELLSSGVRPGRIRIARSSGEGDVSRLPGWPAGISHESVFTIRLPERDRPFRALAGEPLLQALERQRVVPSVPCRSGVCGACRVRLTQGRVFTAPGAPVRSNDRAAGYIYACVSYPLSDLTVALT